MNDTPKDTTRGLTLREFYLTRFKPNRCERVNEQTIGVYERVIAWLGYALQRPATVADLADDEVFHRFYAFCRRHRRSKLTVQGWRRHLRTVAKYAVECGLLDADPDTPPVEGRWLAPPCDAKYSLPGSIAHFYWSVYRPSCLGFASDRELAAADKVISAFEMFAGRSTMLRAVTPARLQDFRRWLVTSGRSKATGEKYIEAVLTILNAATREDYGTDPKESDGNHVGSHEDSEEDEQLAAIGDGGGMGLMELLETHYLTERRVGKKTQDQMRICLERFGHWLGRAATIADLNRLTINTYIMFLEDSYAPATVRGRRGYLLGLWRCAFENEFIETQPVRIRKVKLPRRTPQAWNEDQLRCLLAACRRLDGKLPNGIEKGPFFRALILTGYDTGLRRGDLFRLRRDQLNDDGTVVVQLHKTSVGHTAFIRPETREAIDATFPPDRELLFPWDRHWKMFYYYWVDVLKESGLPESAYGALQKLRRTSASMLENVAPGYAGRHLGHLTPGLAERHYIDPRVARRQRHLPPDILAPRIDED